MERKEIKMTDIINFLQKKYTGVYHARTSQYPKLLPPKNDLIAAAKLIREMIGSWLSYESHVIATKMMYVDGELSKDTIKEYWDVLKDINVEEERRKEAERKKSITKPSPRRSILAEIREMEHI